ncbi:hypothetical protein QTP88_020321 [Uroleucon formosanum]
MASMYTLEQVKNLKKGNKSYANDTYQSRKNNFRMKTWFFLAATNEGKQNAEQQNKQRASQKKGIVLVENNDGFYVTIINICKNHYTKIIVNHVYTYFQSETNNSGTVDKMKRNNVIDWICLLFNAKNLENVENWFKKFLVILLSPHSAGRTKMPLVR